jgi:glycosyltransferase involved in cell wall biosynthesis
MRILVVMSYSPVPIRRGRDRLIKNLIDGLTVRNHVILATMTLDACEEDALERIESARFSTRFMRAPNKRSVLHRAWFKGMNIAKAMTALVPAQVSYARPAAFVEHVKRVAQETQPDLVLANYWHLYDLPRVLGSCAAALITHDVDFLVSAERTERIANPFTRTLARANAFLGERIERKAYAQYDTIFTLTGRDAEAIEHAIGDGSKTIMPLPLALDLQYYKPPELERERDRILFFGALDADFNRDALRFFVREVFPEVRRARPGCRCDCVGHGLDGSLRNELPEGCTYLGGVDDVRPYLARCVCMVLPLRFGGGVRVRMMEAAAMGTPVVSTPVGVAGMGLERGRDYLESVDARGMARSILDLLNDERLARRVGASARRWALGSISMDDYPDRLDACFARIERPSSKSLR